MELIVLYLSDATGFNAEVIRFGVAFGGGTALCAVLASFLSRTF